MESLAFLSLQKSQLSFQILVNFFTLSFLIIPISFPILGPSPQTHKPSFYHSGLHSSGPPCSSPNAQSLFPDCTCIYLPIFLKLSYPKNFRTFHPPFMQISSYVISLRKNFPDCPVSNNSPKRLSCSIPLFCFIFSSIYNLIWYLIYLFIFFTFCSLL